MIWISSSGVSATSDSLATALAVTVPGACSDQTQTPGYPKGDGTCAAPACDVGGVVPVGEYIFDQRAANVSVNGQTLLRWMIDT